MSYVIEIGTPGTPGASDVPPAGNGDPGGNGGVANAKVDVTGDTSVTAKATAYGGRGRKLHRG